MAKHLAALDPEARMNRLIEELTGPEQVFGLHRSDMGSAHRLLTMIQIQNLVNEIDSALAAHSIPVRWISGTGDRS